MYNYNYTEFLISSFGTPLAQRASYFELHSSLFGPDGAINYDYDYDVTNNINYLLIGSRCIPNAAHTSHALLGQFGPCFKRYQKFWLHVHVYVFSDTLIRGSG